MPATAAAKLEVLLRHGWEALAEQFPLGNVNEARNHLWEGKVR